jgi:hypothetical protein
VLLRHPPAAAVHSHSYAKSAYHRDGAETPRYRSQRDLGAYQISQFGMPLAFTRNGQNGHHIRRLRARAPIAIDDTALPADGLGSRAEQHEQLALDTVFEYSNISEVN